MGNIINPADLAFNGEEVKTVAECIMEEVFSKPALTEFLTPYTGVKAKKQIVFLGKINGLVGQKHTTDQCAPVENTGTITNTQKFWEPAYIDDRFSECWDDLLDGFFIYATQNGIDKSDLTSTEFADFFVERFNDAIAEMLLRFIWFGDTDAATIADSPQGYFAVADFVAKRWNAFDGLWVQLFAIVAANSSRKTTGLAAKNAQATFLLQEFDATDTTNKVVMTTLQNMIFGADYRLRDKADKLFLVTQSVADQLQRELQAYAAGGIEIAFKFITDGISMLQYNGVRVYAFSFWDRMIRGYMRNASGLGYYLPHRALLSTKTQLVFGTEEETDLAKVDIFYDKTDKKNYFDIGSNLDAKVLEDYMVQLAY